MILAASSAEEVCKALKNGLKITGPNALSMPERAGFDPKSAAAGQARQTFSVFLTTEDVELIKGKMLLLHKRLLKDLNEVTTPPYDYIRVDAFFDPASKVLKILEINSKNASMHELCEWLDDQVLGTVDGQKAFSLNSEIAKNQKLIHEDHSGVPVQKLLYLSGNHDEWLFLQAQTEVYGHAAKLARGLKNIKVTEAGLEYEGEHYRHITRKKHLLPKGSKSAHQEKRLSVASRFAMRRFGYKDYLAGLDFDFIPKSERFNAGKISEYLSGQDRLVLKEVDSGSSKGVFLGGDMRPEEWHHKIQSAGKSPQDYIVQEFVKPPKMAAAWHGLGLTWPAVQLGVFVLPNPNNGEIEIDVYARARLDPKNKYFIFDPAGSDSAIAFGNVIVVTKPLML